MPQLEPSEIMMAQLWHLQGMRNGGFVFVLELFMATICAHTVLLHPSLQDIFIKKSGTVKCEVGRYMAMQQCNKILLADEHTLLSDEYAFLEDGKPTGNQGNESGINSDLDDKADPDPKPDTPDMHQLYDIVIIVVLHPLNIFLFKFIIIKCVEKCD